MNLLPYPWCEAHLSFSLTGEGELQADSLSDGKEKAKEGDVFFVPAYTEIKLSTSGRPESMQLYRAGVNSRFFS
jgi:mannose-6-phosphate isomerase